MRTAYKILPLLGLIAVCSVSCNNGNEGNGSVLFKLVADKTEISPLEPVTIRLEPSDFSLLERTYDEIWLESEGSFWDGTIRLGAAAEDNKFQFTHYQPGIHKITARGYKNEKLISEDVIEVNVGRPTGDFLHIDWGIKKFESFSYRPPLKKLEGEGEKYFRIDLTLVHSPEYSYNDGIEYALLQLMPFTLSYSRSNAPDAIELPDIYDFDWLPYEGYDREEMANNMIERNRFEYALLNGLITNYYGDPTLEYTGEDLTETDLTEEYRKRFKYPYAHHFYPTRIWETPTSYICLMECSNMINGKKYRSFINIIAEPRH